MESKKLSFNPQFVLRETLRHWPFMVAIIAVYLLTVTGLISWIPIFNVSVEDVTREVVRQLMDISNFTSYVSGIIVAEFAFGYLGSKRKDFFFETLPMNRKSLFLNRFVFGYILVFIPNLFIAIVEIIQIAVISSEVAIMPLVCWLLIVAAQNLFWLSFGTLFIVLCGRKLMAGICYVAFSCLGLLVKFSFIIFDTIFFVGPNSGGDMNLGILSPLEFIYRAGGHTNKNDYHGISGYFGGWNLVVLFLAFAVIIAVAYVLYIKRNSERTGDNFVFPFMKIVFSACFTFVFAMELTIMMTGLCINQYGGVSHYTRQSIAVLIFLIIFAFIGYMISCMIIEKRFKVFRTNLVKALVCTGIFALFIVLYMLDIFKIEKYVPDTDDLFSCRVTGPNYSNDWTNRDYSKDKMSDDEKKVVMELLELISDNMDILVENFKSISETTKDTKTLPNGTVYDVTYHMKYDGIYDVDLNRLYIDMYLEDGRTVYRDYYLRPEGKLYEEIMALIDSHPEYFIKEDFDSTKYDY